QEAPLVFDNGCDGDVGLPIHTGLSVSWLIVSEAITKTPARGRGFCCYQARTLCQRSERRVEGLAWTHDLAGQFGVGAVVTTDINRLALYVVELCDDCSLVFCQRFRQR